MLEPIQLCENGPAFSFIVFGVMKWGDGDINWIPGKCCVE